MTMKKPDPLSAQRWLARSLTALCLGLVSEPALAADVPAAASPTLELHARSRRETTTGSGEFRVIEQRLRWDAKKTAIVICDMWDQHWCQGATARVGEMAPRMNEVVKAARQRGVFIIHCPSGTLGFYKDTPQRKLAQAAPKAPAKVQLKGWCNLDAQREGPLPIDDSDGGCDDQPQCQQGSPWRRQTAAIEIAEGDAITDSEEAYYLMQQRGIENVIVMGVHINMCVLGRPFSIRQMVYQDKQVVLMRDLTDSMYNSRRKPWVNHFCGTELVVEHIEKYWCPSITSADFLGGAPFRFKGDKPDHVVFLIGEGEYHTGETLPEFAGKELAWRGFRCSFVTAPPTGGNDFTNFAAIKDADVLVVSVRRRTPQKEMVALIRQHLNAGKPLVGIRTASHAFAATPPDDRHAAWPNFDGEILGGDYQGHYSNAAPNGPPTMIRVAPEAAAHAVLNGLPADGLRSTSTLYKNPAPGGTITPLLIGWVEGQPEKHPVAWVNTTHNRRVFYTSLGSPADFQQPFFRRLLLNGILWALNQPIPPGQSE